MRKMTLALIAVIVVIGVVFLWLLSGTSPDHANAQPITIEVEDNFER